MYYKAHIVYDHHDYGYSTVYVDRRLARMPYAQAGIRFRDGMVILVSYDTECVYVDKFMNVKVVCLYSKSTIRHISAFLREVVGDIYHKAKKTFLADNWYDPNEDKYMTNEEHDKFLADADL